MKFRDTVGRYRPSPKWRSWRPSPSVLVTVVSLLVLTGSVAWASDASVRLTATDPGTGAQHGIGVRYTDDGNGGYDQTVVRADVSVSDDAYVRQIATDANGQQTGINVAYHDTGGGSYVPVVQEVNAQGTPVSGGGSPGATPTPSCADLGGDCTFTNLTASGSNSGPALNVTGVQPTPVGGATGTDAQDVVHVVGGTGGSTTSSAATTTGGNGSEVYMVSGNGGAPTNGATQFGGSGGDNVWQGGDGAAVSDNNATVEQDGGNGGTVLAQPGAGGAATGSGGGNNFGGSAGAFAAYPANGGNAANGAANYGGTGSSAQINAGSGGDGSTQGGDAGVVALNLSPGHGGVGAVGGHGSDVKVATGNGGATNGRAGTVDVTFGTPDGTGATGKFTVQGATEFDSAGRPVLSGCVLNAATPVAGSVLTASSATACSFVTPAAGATGTPVPTATPAPPVAQQNYCGASVTSVISVTHYVSVNCGANSTTESAVQIAAPSATTAQNLYITTQATEGASGNLTVTLRKNGVDTTLKVTVNANSAAGNYSDTTHTVSLAAGDLIDFSTIDSGNATSAPWIAAMTLANGVATGTCVLTSATPVPGTFLYAQASNNCVWSTPTAVPTATLVATATPQATPTKEIHAAVTQNTPAAGTVLYFPGAQPTPGVYTSLSSLSSKQFITGNVVGGQGGFCAGGTAGLQITANGIVYIAIPGGDTGSSCSSGNTNHRNVLPYAATVSLLTVHTGNGVSQPASGALVCTLQVAPPTGPPANTALAATVTAGGAPSTYQDAVNTASIGALDTYDVTCHNTTNLASSAFIQAISMAITPA